MLRIDVKASRELQAVLLAVRQVPKELQAQIRQQTKAMLAPEWQKAMREHAQTRLEHRVLADTARVSVSNQNVRISAAGLKKSATSGLNPSVVGRAVEFGANRESYSTYSRKSGKGGTHKVKRRTRRHLRPANGSGYVFYPAAANIIPRLAALWVQTTVRTLAEAFERK